MAEKTIEKLSLVYRIVLSIFLVISGICLIAVCIGIYLSGDKAFSREAVATGFARICVPVILTLVLVVLGWVLDIFVPGKKAKPELQYVCVLRRLKKTNDLSGIAPDTQKSFDQLEQKRRLHKTVTSLLIAFGSAAFLIYALIPSRYHQQQINRSVIQVVIVMVGSLLPGFIWGVYAGFYEKKATLKQIELVRQAIKDGQTRKVAPSPAPIKKKIEPYLIVRWAVLLVGIAAFVYGAIAGGAVDVLTKAINICTECVGLG